MAEAGEEFAAEAGAPTPVDAESGLAAAALAVARRRRDGDSDANLDAFLDKQGRLIEVQLEHLHEQRELILSRLRWGRFSDRMKAGLQVMTAAVGLAVVAVIAVMAWQAHSDHGVAIKAFSAPPDLAGRGLTGQVIANELLDRLADLQARTVTARPASTYANDWGGDIKVEIPETGVSIGELNRYLREWLGSETRITGEVVRTPTGLTVTARAGSEPGRTFAGPEGSLDALVGQAAEAIYAETQPYRYAVYLASHGRQPEATALFARLAQSGASADRPWAYAGWASILQAEGRHYDAIRMARAAIALNPRLDPPYETLGVSSDVVGHWDTDNVAQELALVRSGGALGLPGDQKAERIRFLQAVHAYYRSDFLAAAQGLGTVEAFDLEGRLAGYAPRHLRARSLASLHEVAAAGPLEAGPLDTNSYQAIATGGATLGDWQEIATRLEQGRGEPGLAGDAQGTVVQPLLAEAYAYLGRLQEAKALVAATPEDCYRCLAVRAEIAGLERDWTAADRWWAELDRLVPTRALGPAGWAKSLLERGDLDRAITEAEAGHRRSPHFADPLETWGEALMRKGDFGGAVAKFAQADADAPRWGRNHLMWGEALARLGRADEAKAQWRAAAGMDLSTADRAKLNGVQASSAEGPSRG